MNYPTARKDGTTYSLHSVEIQDPYRHLEDSFAQETKNFVNAQNALTDPYLAKFEHSAALQQTLESHTTYPLVSSLTLSNDYYYWQSNPSSLPQPLWRRCAKSDLDLSTFTGEDGEVFFDINSLSKEGDTASEMWGKWSASGKYWATMVSRGGSDWQTVIIIDTTTGKQVDEELLNVKFCWHIEWLGDEAFIYKTLPPKHKDDTSAEGGFATILHVLGTPQTSDKYLWSDPANPQHSVLIPRITDDGRHLVLDVFGSTEPVTRLLAADRMDLLTKDKVEFRDVNVNWDASYFYITTNSAGESIFLSSRDKATRKALISTDLGVHSKPTQWKVVVPEREDAVLDRAQALGDGLILLVYLKDVGHEVWIYKDSGEAVRRVSDAELSWSGMIKDIKRGKDAKEFSIESWSFIAPPTLYRGVVKNGDVEFSVVHTASVEGWKEADFVQKQVFYGSKDGTKVPMFLAHSKLLDLSKPHPTLLFGYGGFVWTQEPKWEPFFSSFIQSFNGILAVAGIRGGGEYGNAWHEAAAKDKRQTAFDDFIAAGRFLKDEGIASKLAIYGSSNGGLLCGAVCNQAPDLVDAALPDVGVMDLLRFHKFTMGGLWTAEYGDPDEQKYFDSLIKISPLHNITPELNYPPIFLTTAEHDSRVIPGHTLKFAATLQDKKKDNPNPILCRVYQDTGHGMGKTTTQTIKENHEKLSFLALAMRLKFSL